MKILRRQYSLLLSTLLVTLVLGLGSFEAHAQDVDPQKAADAQALFEQATADMESKQYANACKKFEEVTRLVPEGAGGKYMLGDCYEKLGKLASAWAQFSFAAQLAGRFGQTDRATDATARAEALRPKLATLSVSLPASLRLVTGISVVRDGIDLREPQWGTPIYVDSGSHEVIVNAPGYSTWKKRVEVLTDGVQVKLAVPEDAIKPEKKEPASVQNPVGPVVIIAPAPDRSWQRPLGITLSVLGAATLATGSILGGAAIAKRNESNESGHCTLATNKCDDEGLTMRKDAVGLGNASTGFYLAGAVVGVVGVTLWVTAPNAQSNNEKKKSSERVEVRAGFGRLDVHGQF